MRPFRCLVTILNTIDHLGKFNGKAAKGFFVGYSLNSKAFRVFNSRTRIVEENLHIRFSESTPNVVGSGPDWLFDIDALTRTINYEPLVLQVQKQVMIMQVKLERRHNLSKIIFCYHYGLLIHHFPKIQRVLMMMDPKLQVMMERSSTFNTADTNRVITIGDNISIKLQFDSNMHDLEYVSIFDFSSDDEDDGAVANMNNLDTTIQVSPIPTTRIHKDHPLNQVIGDLQSATQTRKISKNLKEHGFVSTIQQRTNHKDLQNCLFACFLSQEEPKKDLRFEDPDFPDRVYKVEKYCIDYIKLLELDGEEVDVHMYRSMIGSLMYLTSSRPDIIIVVCACATYQVNLKVSHLYAVKRTFRYLKGQLKLGLCYLKDSPFDLVAYTDSDYAGASLDKKSTIGDKAVHKELGDSLVRAATIASSLEAEQDSVDTFDDLFDYLQKFEKLVNTSRAKKLEKSHDSLALQDDIQTNSEDPLTSAMLLLARAITQNLSNPTNNHLRTSSNTRNQAVIQFDRVNIQSRILGNAGRNNRRAYVQKEVVQGSNETGNVQRTLRNSSSGNTSTDEAEIILIDEQNDFLFADASRMEEIKDLSANIFLMARIQPTNYSSDVGPSYDSAFVSEVQSSSINENEEQMYPNHTKIINSTIGNDKIDSNIIFDTPNGNVNSSSVEKDTHVFDLCALEQLARNAYHEAEKQQIFAQKVQKQNKTLTSQLELYKERVRVLENINEDNNYLNEFLEADQRAKHFDQQAHPQFICDRDIFRDLKNN
uniref:Ribonuclease H-like domain, reverse transcriptase, RNA-dependent DNA polymerase n=1 Tax=Tanacetum cinerariifolium TaxID=118510 RepID=A0A6L2P2E4_TANCI|nr:ribonuclease H-like domain, reverse transcriptase, RNA-dependent DNA polymerase [Tanacetum cinerariifolium]